MSGYFALLGWALLLTSLLPTVAPGDEPFALDTFEAVPRDLRELGGPALTNSLAATKKLYAKAQDQEHKDLLALRLAYLQHRSDNNVQCLTLQEPKPDFLLGDQTLWWTARCARELGRYYLERGRKLERGGELFERAERSLEKLRREYPQSPRCSELDEELRRLNRLRGLLAAKRKKPDEVIVYLERSNTDLGGSEAERYELGFHLLTAYFAKGFRTRASELARELSLFREQSQEQRERLTALLKEQGLVLPTAAPILRREVGRSLVAGTKNPYHPQGFEAYLADFKKRLEAGEYAALGTVLTEGSELFGGVKGFQEVVTILGKNLLTRLADAKTKAETLEHLYGLIARLDAPSQLVLARRVRETGKLDVAEKLYVQTLRRDPRSSSAEEAAYDLARMFEDHGQAEKAFDYFSRVVERYPESKYLEHSIWKVGWWLYRLGRYTEAIKWFDTYLSQGRYTQFQTPVLYWKARCHERLDDRRNFLASLNTLMEYFPWSYYGTVARIQEIGDLGPMFRKDLEFAPRSRSVRLDFRERRDLARAERLLALGFFEEAEQELRRIGLDETDPQFLYYLAILANRCGMYHRSIQIAERVGSFFSGRLPFDLATILYPRAYQNLFAGTSKEPLDEFWLLSLIRQESMFRTEAVSSAKARGLMQLLLSTARGVAGNRAIGESDLHQPATNVELGIRYLQRLLERFGSLPYALGAYNAGEAAMASWIKHFGSYPVAEFIEAIPYKETRGYVKLITRNYLYYSYLYKNKAFRSLEEVYRPTAPEAPAARTGG
ncbi:MAG: hypothetical protein A2284_15420 [Deltaproteobacteria bacterium RIFOXYA12_FULL_61_11]|nr:MAG: hypothetical protein A2284_15420 [Deltaproteobacteria bacterium RIFOXYA12_FULL_61_11]